VEKYGLWILLAPPRRASTCWCGGPFVALGAGLVLVLLLVRRWSRRSAGASPGPAPDAAMRARIHREMAEREP